MPQDLNILVVGCGGTGGFVSEGLCRLLINSDISIILIDHDRVEEHNLRRQHFFEGDVGKFKSQALAERLARQYGRPVGYSVYPYSSDLIGENYGGGLVKLMAQGIIIGCVDNAEARIAIAETFNRFSFGNWWIDAGNGFSSGQVLIGNTPKTEYLEGAFDDESNEVDRLPLPSWQLPGLLIPPTSNLNEAVRDCAEAVVADDQGPVINQAMATLVLEFVHRLLNNKLTWMGVYLDLDAGTLQAVPAEPITVARMCGVKVDTLIRKISIGRRGL